MEVNKREEHAKKIMDAYHEKYGKSMEEKEKEDELKMFENMKKNNIKEDLEE